MAQTWAAHGVNSSAAVKWLPWDLEGEKAIPACTYLEKRDFSPLACVSEQHHNRVLIFALVLFASVEKHHCMGEPVCIQRLESEESGANILQSHLLPSSFLEADMPYSCFLATSLVSLAGLSNDFLLSPLSTGSGVLKRRPQGGPNGWFYKVASSVLVSRSECTWFLYQMQLL